MSISLALLNAQSGLKATSRMAEVISGNVANASNPAYSRREVQLSERIGGGVGMGVTIDGVLRNADPATTFARRRAEASSALQSTVADAMNRLAEAVGKGEAANTLSVKYGDFDRALVALQSEPASATLQREAVRNASSIAAALNELSAENARMRVEADGQIAREISGLNDNLVRVAELNRDIMRLEANGRDTSALTDQRQAVVDEISRVVPVRSIPRDNGSITIVSTGGGLLLEGTKAQEVLFSSTPVITASQTYSGGGLSGATLFSKDVTPGAGSNYLAGGALEGLFEVRDTLGEEFDAQIDALAADLITRFEDPTVDTTLAVGDPGLFTDAGAAYNAASVTGLAGRIAVNAAVDPDAGGEVRRIRDGINSLVAGPSGSSTLIVAQIDVFNDVRAVPAGLGITTSQSAIGAAAELTAGRAGEALFAEAQSVGLVAQYVNIRDQELNFSGVDLDRELNQLLLVEQSYAANARVISVADELLRTLLEI